MQQESHGDGPSGSGEGKQHEVLTDVRMTQRAEVVEHSSAVFQSGDSLFEDRGEPIDFGRC